MRALGIIAEYNPFHNGHLYQLTEARKISGCTAAVAVMSGDFTQRGEPAVCDKWSRAAAAVRCGIDLVIELPLLFAVRSAESFAGGAVRLLNSLGAVDALCFGAETADIALLRETAALLGEPSVQAAIKQFIGDGRSYAAAVDMAVRTAASAACRIMDKPNNILAVEYLKALRQYAPHMRSYAVQRRLAEHNDGVIRSSIASATAIRQALSAKSSVPYAVADAMPEPAWQTLKAAFDDIPSLDNLTAAALSRLRIAKPAELARYAGLSEGLENRLIQSSLTAATLCQLLQTASSKRYPLTRLQRSIVHILLNVTTGDLLSADHSGPLYVRVLAFNNTGKNLLKQFKTTAALPVITKITDYLNTGRRAKTKLTPLQTMLAVDTYAADLYSLCYDKGRSGAADFTSSPAYIDNRA